MKLTLPETGAMLSTSGPARVVVKVSRASSSTFLGKHMHAVGSATLSSGTSR